MILKYWEEADAYRVSDCRTLITVFPSGSVAIVRVDRWLLCVWIGGYCTEVVINAAKAANAHQFIKVI